VALQAGVEAERGQHDRRIELRDLGAVTLARLEDPERGQRSGSSRSEPRETPHRAVSSFSIGRRSPARSSPLLIIRLTFSMTRPALDPFGAAPGSGMASA